MRARQVGHDRDGAISAVEPLSLTGTDHDRAIAHASAASASSGQCAA
jgi:hypothetical protein